MIARRFTPAGLRRFEELLANGGSPDDELLTSPVLSEPLPASFEVEKDALSGTRRQAAEYLDTRLTAAGFEEPERDAALWAWLAAFYFDVLSPRDTKGRRKPGSKARYVPLLDDSWRTYRHLLLGPYLVHAAHRDDPARALCLLCQPLSRPGQLVERFASRPRLVACPAAVGAATHLFCDKGGAIRRGALASVDRLTQVLMQLDRTYDLYGMTADGLLKLLPREFDAFKRAAPRKR